MVNFVGACLFRRLLFVLPDCLPLAQCLLGEDLTSCQSLSQCLIIEDLTHCQPLGQCPFEECLPWECLPMADFDCPKLSLSQHQESSHNLLLYVYWPALAV